MGVRRFAIVAFLTLVALPQSVTAGTTGGIRGRVTDAQTGAPVTGARVSAAGSAQTATAVTDSSGAFGFNSLQPDEYQVTVSKDGFGNFTAQSIVFADQTVTLDVALGKGAAKAARGATGILTPGVTSNFASIDAPTIRALRGLQGNDSFDQTYAAMNSQPGIFSPQGQAGWYQRIYIRGGDQDQPGYEYDGIPVERRDWQSSPVINFSALGVQELQVYTGGLLATSDATGIAGYINEVVKSGTSPGYAAFDLGVGAPSFYHSTQFEAGGATDNFSYYVGILGANATYRYVNQQNGAGLQPSYFFPVQLQNANGFCNSVPAGFTAVSVPVAPISGSMCFDSGQQAWNGHAGFVSGPGAVYGINTTWDRENVGNFHFQIPHHKDGLKDDVQVLVMQSELYNTFQNSLNDLGGPWPNVNAGSPFLWQDGLLYTGPVGAPPNGQTSVYAYPGSPAHPFLGALPTNKGDYWSNGAAITKVQYQWNIDPKSFLRVFGYTSYTDWLLNSPASLNLAYGLMAADWEPNTHTYGYVLDYANQLGTQHYLTVNGAYEWTRTHGWSSFGYFGQTYTPVSNLIGNNGYCYNPTSGNQDSCYDWSSRGTIGTGGYFDVNGSPLNMGTACAPGGSLAGTPACLHRAQFVITENGANHLSWDANTQFTSGAFNDSWRPSERTTADLG